MSNLTISIWNKPIGRILWDTRSNSANFAYLKEFQASGIELAPVRMPLSNEVYNFRNLPRKTFSGLPGMIADSLPDRFGKALIETFFHRRNYKFNDLLPTDWLAYVGRRGMGALEYEPDYDVPHKSDVIPLDDLKELASFGLKKAEGLLTEVNEKDTSRFEDILTVGTSAGGARAKAVIAFNETTGVIRSGQLELDPGFGHWIIKLDVGKEANHLDKPQGYGASEFTYYQIARDAGIRMMECRLMSDNERLHFMTRRYDREEGGIKHHVTTLTGMTHIDYEDVGSHSYNNLFQTAKYLKVPYADMEQLYKQMVFNVVMSNCDDHTKNFAFMLYRNNPGQWRVTPAYDMAYSYDPSNSWVKDHMSINGKRKGILWKDLVEEGNRQGIKKPEDLARQVLDASVKFHEYGRANSVPPNMLSRIQNRINEVHGQLQVSALS